MTRNSCGRAGLMIYYYRGDLTIGSILYSITVSTYIIWFKVKSFMRCCSRRWDVRCRVKRKANLTPALWFNRWISVLSWLQDLINIAFLSIKTHTHIYIYLWRWLSYTKTKVYIRCGIYILKLIPVRTRLSAKEIILDFAALNVAYAKNHEMANRLFPAIRS